MNRALRDDRIARMVAAVREREATLWLIVDSCHSGTLSRAAGEEARAKELGPADFGLAASAAVSAPVPAGGPARPGPAQ